jgi:hypothetical protein
MCSPASDESLTENPFLVSTPIGSDHTSRNILLFARAFRRYRRLQKRLERLDTSIAKLLLTTKSFGESKLVPFFRDVGLPEWHAGAFLQGCCNISVTKP